MKIVNVYHSIDLDGWMSAAIVKLWWEKQPVETINGEYKRNDIDFIGYNYGDPIPDLSKYDKVIMCDISFPAPIMFEIQEKLWERNHTNDNFIYIDHHISAIKSLEHQIEEEEILDIGYPEGIRDTKYSACELTWQYFFPNKPMPEIVRLLGLYDSFRHKGTDEEQKVLEFQYGARQVIWNYETAYDRLLETIKFEKALLNIHLSGASIYDYLCTEAKQTYKNGFKITLFGEDYITYQFICINKERFNPINFGIDYHKDGYDGCACFHYANGMWNFSLYNDNGKVDCSAIAKQYGGGGHRLASGFRVNNKDFSKIINNGRGN